MRKQLLAGTAFAAVALMGTAAFAADMPAPAPVAPLPMAPAPAPIFYDWSGPYVGAHIGYGWGRHRAPAFARTGEPSGEWEFDQDDFENNEFVGEGPPFSFPMWDPDRWDPPTFDINQLGDFELIVMQDVFYHQDVGRLRGIFGGLQAGYNFMVSPDVLLGIEADFSWSNIRGRGWAEEIWERESRVFTESTGLPNFVAHEEFKLDATMRKRIDWFGTARARLGLPMDNVLPYVTGGLAWGRVKSDIAFRMRGEGAVGIAGDDWEIVGDPEAVWGPETLFAGAASSRDTRFGWTIGGGVEVALDQNWSIKGEYLYIDLGTKTHNFHIVDSGETHTFSHRQRVNLHTVKLGVNYRFFTGPAPAPAAPAPVKW